MSAQALLFAAFCASIGGITYDAGLIGIPFVCGAGALVGLGIAMLGYLDSGGRQLEKEKACKCKPCVYCGR